jgi:hypothetical protein
MTQIKLKGTLLAGFGLLLTCGAMAESHPGLVGVSVPTSLASGKSGVGHVKLSGKTTSALSIFLSSNSGAALVGKAVNVPAGSDGADFPVTAGRVKKSSKATITATLGDHPAASVLTVVPAFLSVFQATAEVNGGQDVSGSVGLTGVTADAIDVSISSSDASVQAEDVFVQGGDSSAAFVFHTSAVTASVTAVLTATYGGVSLSQNVLVRAPNTGKLVLSSARVIGGRPDGGGVILGQKAGDGGVVVSLASNSPAASVPSSIKIRRGEGAGTFGIKTNGVDAEVNVTITATFSGGSKSASLLVEPAALDHLGMPDQVASGASGQGYVSLNGFAGPSGSSVSLSSDNAALVLPASVSVAANAYYAVFSFSSSVVTDSVHVNVSATMGTVKRLTVVTLKASRLFGFSGPNAVVGGESVHLHFELAGKAPDGGAVIALSADPSGVLALPASVTIPAGHHDQTFSFPSSAVTANTVVTVTATYNGQSLKLAITVVPPPHRH